VIKVFASISHTEALVRIESCNREYDLGLLMHKYRGKILCFSFEQEEELEDAVNAQFLLIQANRILNG